MRLARRVCESRERVVNVCLALVCRGRRRRQRRRKVCRRVVTGGRPVVEGADHREVVPKQWDHEHRDVLHERDKSVMGHGVEDF